MGGENPMATVIATHESHDGDLYFLPAGRLHAIGAGNFLAEIQQTRDITYRVYDFGRKVAHGKPRERHVEHAKDAIDYQVWPGYRTSYDFTKPTSQLIKCPYFIVHRVVVLVPASENVLYIFGNATFPDSYNVMWNSICWLLYNNIMCSIGL